MPKRPPKPRSRKTKKVERRDRLTLKQRAFVVAFLGEAKGNATKAARLAGYQSKSDQGFSRIAEETRRSPEVAKAIEEGRRELESAGMATAVEIQTYFTRAMRAAKETLDGPITDDTVKNFAPLWNVGTAAAAQLVKVQGLAAPKKHEHTGTVELPIALTPELEAALDEWLMVRADPRVQAVIAEVRGEV